MKAMQEFWMNEDLLELLLSMLDLASILALASVCLLALGLIKRPLVWQHLLRTSWQLILKDSFDVDLVTGLLKMTRDPEPLLLVQFCHVGLLFLTCLPLQGRSAPWIGRI